MIPAVDIHRQAARDGVKERVVEKDYALTWFLLAVSECPEPHKSLWFKGGTCIRKMYFPRWRYSEDVDFTLAASGRLQDCASWVADIAKRAGRLSGIVYSLQAPESQADDSSDNQILYVDYVGPLQRIGTPRKFKVDITATELLIDRPTLRKVGGLFADQKDHGGKILAYSLEEICAEKLRSLLQRREPRDLYDIWRLLTNGDDLDNRRIAQMFVRKCEFKGMRPPEFGRILGEHNCPTLKKLWDVRLGEQLVDLPHVDAVVRETRRLLRALET